MHIFEPIKRINWLMNYIWGHKNWPEFHYSTTEFKEVVISFAEKLGVVNGLLMGLKEELYQEAFIELLIMEAIKTSEIEGEYMSREDVISSIKNNLKLQATVPVKDKRVIGVAKLMTAIKEDLNKDLSLEMISHWHELLVGHNKNISTGKWRTGKEPMQIVSGSYGREIVHFEAPPSHEVPEEMDKFITWYHNFSSPLEDKFSIALLKSAIAHLYFETIHPFEDGNGRIGRAISEFILAKTLGVPLILSLSSVIEKNRKEYYAQLKQAQRAKKLDITEWINYFAGVILRALKDAIELIRFTLLKSKFFDEHSEKLNDRQLKVINRMLEKGMSGFEGGMTAKKYMRVTKISKSTATRDLQYLEEQQIFLKEGQGRSTRYHLNLIA